MGESFKPRSASPKTHKLFSDLSDLSSVSSAPESGGDFKATDAEKNHGRELDSNKVTANCCCISIMEDYTLVLLNPVNST